MSKLLQDEISIKDINNYLEESSDFLFELEILKLLKDMDFETSHGGAYTDPIEGKIREYDIRAKKELFGCSISLAIECKNIKSFYPLLLQRTPCTKDESGINFIINRHPNPSLTVFDHDYIPKINEFVGTSATQIGRLDDKSNSLKFSDSEIYTKWTQAINSCFDLVKNSFDEYYKSSNKLFIILPILVIPNERLWVVDFNTEKLQKSDPIKAEYSCLYIGQSLGFKSDPQKYIISELNFTANHLHICTKKGLSDFIDRIHQFVKDTTIKYGCNSI
jgi:hypothetical protein